MLAVIMASCESGESSGTCSGSTGSDSYEPEYVEQVVTHYCTTCGGSGQVMSAYGPANCPGCTAYGRPAQWQETVTVPNPNYKGGSKTSFKGGRIKNGCNISGHNCNAGVDGNGDGWCDNCENNGYNCHMVDHVGTK